MRSVAARRLRVWIATHHARQFRLALRALDRANAGRSALLLDDEVLVAECGRLGEVRDDDDLSRLSQALQAGADLGCGLAADARINLIEDERGGGLGSPEQEFEREHDA